MVGWGGGEVSLVHELHKLRLSDVQNRQLRLIPTHAASDHSVQQASQQSNDSSHPIVRDQRQRRRHSYNDKKPQGSKEEPYVK